MLDLSRREAFVSAAVVALAAGVPSWALAQGAGDTGPAWDLRDIYPTDAASQAKYLCEDSGTTVLFVSHDMDAIMRVCNRVVWIDRGQVVAALFERTIDRTVGIHGRIALVARGRVVDERRGAGEIP